MPEMALAVAAFTLERVDTRGPRALFTRPNADIARVKC